MKTSVVPSTPGRERRPRMRRRLSAPTCRWTPPGRRWRAPPYPRTCPKNSKKIGKSWTTSKYPPEIIRTNSVISHRTILIIFCMLYTILYYTYLSTYVFLAKFFKSILRFLFTVLFHIWDENNFALKQKHNKILLPMKVKGYIFKRNFHT